MKKLINLLCVVAILSFTFIACDKKKDADDQVEVEDVQIQPLETDTMEVQTTEGDSISTNEVVVEEDSVTVTPEN